MQQVDVELWKVMNSNEKTNWYTLKHKAPLTFINLDASYLSGIVRIQQSVMPPALLMGATLCVDYLMLTPVLPSGHLSTSKGQKGKLAQQGEDTRRSDAMSSIGNQTRSLAW